MYTLRNHQQIIYDKIVENVKKGKKKILVLGATGFGKTILAYVISKNALNKGNRVLFTNHRIALAKQTYKKFSSLTPELLQGSNKLINKESNLIIATLQTLINEDIPEPKIIIIDECHYAYESNLVQSLFDKYPKAIFIGLSATPVDNKDFLLNGWDTILDDYQTKDLIDLGMLTPFEYFAPTSIDFSKVKIKGSDYDENSLTETIEKNNINKTVVENYQKLGENRKFIAFATNKEHCKQLKNEFDKTTIKTQIIDANTSDKKREQYISDLKENRLNGLISIEILTAGFDEPTVSCIILATKTMQWKKYIQCVGRGIRLIGNNIEESIENGKSNCYLLDFCSNIEYHGIPTDKKVFRFNKQISKVIDRQLKIDKLDSSIASVKISKEKEIHLKRIGSLLDLYDGKVYAKENDLQEDVNNFLKKTNFFWWRQNSGKANIQGRWVHFASKSGLPDNTVFYKDTSFYFGLELKLPKGYLTRHQKITLPEMIEKNVLFFICESVFDVYQAIEHIDKNIFEKDNFIMINKDIYKLPSWQKKYRNKLNLQ